MNRETFRVFQSSIRDKFNIHIYQYQMTIATINPFRWEIYERDGYSDGKRRLIIMQEGNQISTTTYNKKLLEDLISYAQTLYLTLV